MRYLLDTNILSDLLRHPLGSVAGRIASAGVDSVCTSIVVAAELRFGAMHKGSPRLTALVDGLLQRVDVLPLAPPADRVYGELRARLAVTGRPIGANDLLIAAHALTLDCILVTANTREFARIGELRLENWLEDGQGD